MEIQFWWIGKTNESYLTQGIELFSKRLKHYCKWSIVEFKDVKKQSNPAQLKKEECQLFISKLEPQDYLVLLDEKGKHLSSVQFSEQLNKWQMMGSRRIVFLIAGAFGADEMLQNRADFQLSLSKMTFSHQMIRVFFAEQLYRAFTILRNEKYHNE